MKISITRKLPAIWYTICYVKEFRCQFSTAHFGFCSQAVVSLYALGINKLFMMNHMHAAGCSHHLGE